MQAELWEWLWNVPVRGMQSAGPGVTGAPALTAHTKPCLASQGSAGWLWHLVTGLLQTWREVGRAAPCTAVHSWAWRGFFKIWWHQALKPPKSSLLLALCFPPYMECYSHGVTVQGPWASQSLMTIRSFLISAFLAECPWLSFWCEGEALSKHRTGNWELLGSHASSHTIHLRTWASPFNVFCLSFPFYSWEKINTSSVKDSQLIC